MNQPVKWRLRTLDEAEDLLAKFQNVSPKTDMPGQWPLPVMLDHCAESLEFALTGFPKMKPEWFRMIVGPIAKHVFLWRGQMSHNTLDPIPGDENLPHSASEKEAFDRLFRAISTFKTWNREVAEHFAYGKLNRAEAEKLQAFHIADHLSTMAYRP